MIADERPETETNSNRVRAAFVRFLALGGDERAAVHERGVDLQGAWLTDPFDLDGAVVERDLRLWNCRIERLDAHNCSLKSLNLGGSRLVGGLAGDGLHCNGSVLLRHGFHASEEIRLLDARIDGILDCNAGEFEGKKEQVLSCDRAQIGGSVFFGHTFHATGEVRLPGATIGGSLECSGGWFQSKAGRALSCDGATISGDVFLHHGFHASGTVRLLGVKIGGMLSCSEGRFENPIESALLCDRAEVQDGLFMDSTVHIIGGIDLSSMHVGRLCDEPESWKGLRGQLALDGFTYGRIGGGPTDARTRIAWLDMQLPEHLATEFRPQPWEQLITVLRAMGHPDEARAVAVAKQDRLRRANKIVRGAWTLHFLYGLLVGYGYRPLRLLVSTGILWLICSVAYWTATNPAWFDAETHLLAPPPAELGHVVSAPDYRNFVPLIYSADVLLPVVDLGYKEEWQPVVADRAGNPLIWGQLLRFLYWFEIAFGWVAGLLLVGVLGNLIKKD